MKNSTLLLLGTAMVLALATGCGNSLKKNPLPTGSTTSDNDAPTRAPNLNTAPLSGAGNATGTGITGSVPGELPDDSKLAGRDTDRSRFTAETVYFDYDRSEVKAANVANVGKVASAFKSLPPGHDLLIEGHCDERGTEGYNQALGERRALAVRELLIRAGVDANHVFTKSMGKDQPVQLGHDEMAFSKNRRGEFVLVLPKKITTTQNSQ
jgi:peptidoglycan-associated lipoprotein